MDETQRRFVAGIGGKDTELYANTLQKGKAFVTASTAMTTGREFLEMFKKTVSYKKLAGLTRGQKPVAVDDQLAECFSSFISIGNYFSLSNSDEPYVIEELEINPFVFNDSMLVALDGLKFIKALKEAVINGKDVIIYKAGKTQEGKHASGSHTASIAGDYQVFESCVRQAGGIVASSFTQFNEVLMIARLLNNKPIRGNRIAALSGAGFEAVGMADNVEIDGYHLKMSVLSDGTVKRLYSLLKEKNLAHLTQVKNPMDLNPGADDEAHLLAIKYLAEDEGVDAVIVGLDPLSPVTKTLSEPGIQRYYFNSPGSVVLGLPELANNFEKPVLGVIDAGKRFDPMADELKSRGVIIFRSSDRALRALSVYLNSRLSKGLR